MRMQLDDSYDFGMPAVDAFLRGAYEALASEDYQPWVLYGAGEPDAAVWMACADLRDSGFPIDREKAQAAIDELDREGFPLEPRIKAWIEAKIS